MATEEITMAMAKSSQLDAWGRFVLMVNWDSKRIGVFGPTNIEPEQERELLERAKSIVLSCGDDMKEIMELLVKLLGNSPKITPSLNPRIIKTLDFGNALETLIERTPQPPDFPTWNSEAVIRELLATKQQDQLCEVFSTIYPVKCEAYLLAGIFRTCFKKIGVTHSEDTKGITLRLRNLPLLMRVVKILQLRTAIMKSPSIPAMLKALGVNFDWNMVNMIIDDVNLLAKKLGSTGVYSSDGLWKVLDEIATRPYSEKFLACTIRLVDIGASESK